VKYDHPGADSLLSRDIHTYEEMGQRAAVQASMHDLNLGNPEIFAGEVLVNIESDA
jgi:hypothetical protein